MKDKICIFLVTWLYGSSLPTEQEVPIRILASPSNFCLVENYTVRTECFNVLCPYPVLYCVQKIPALCCPDF